MAHRARRWHAVFSTRPRLWSSVALGVAVYFGLPMDWTHHLGSRALVAWNAGAVAYLLLAWHMVSASDLRRTERRALAQDEGRLAMLTMVFVAAVAVLVAVTSQLAAIRELPAAAKTPHVLLAALTVITSWLFTQTMLALHYAHDFYLGRSLKRPDRLIFPGTTDPDYADFFYFSCVIGTSGQTADVVFNGSDMRPVGVMHCILAFFFNTTVLALTINIAAGLF